MSFNTYKKKGREKMRSKGFFKIILQLREVPGVSPKGTHPTGMAVAWCEALLLQAVVSHTWDADLGSVIADTASLHCWV